MPEKPKHEVEMPEELMHKNKFIVEKKFKPSEIKDVDPFLRALPEDYPTPVELEYLDRVMIIPSYLQEAKGRKEKAQRPKGKKVFNKQENFEEMQRKQRELQKEQDAKKLEEEIERQRREEVIKRKLEARQMSMSRGSSRKESQFSSSISSKLPAPPVPSRFGKATSIKSNAPSANLSTERPILQNEGLAGNVPSSPRLESQNTQQMNTELSKRSINLSPEPTSKIASALPQQGNTSVFLINGKSVINNQNNGPLLKLPLDTLKAQNQIPSSASGLKKEYRKDEPLPRLHQLVGASSPNSNFTKLGFTSTGIPISARPLLKPAKKNPSELDDGLPLQVYRDHKSEIQSIKQQALGLDSFRAAILTKPT